MFLEYDDIYYGLGHTHITVGLAVLERYAEARSNHEVVCALGKLLGCAASGVRDERGRTARPDLARFRARDPGRGGGARLDRLR